MTPKKINIFIVDDEPSVLRVISEIIERAGYSTKTFNNALDCIKKLEERDCELVITDVNMPKISGIQLLARVKKYYPWIPVLIITGFGDIPMAVKSIQLGAFDFIQKPFDRQDLLNAVESSLLKKDNNNEKLGKNLTKTEKIVLQMLASGRANKEIAYLLKRSTRTIEDHRRHIMQKLGAENLLDLIKYASSINLIKNPQDHST